MCAGTRIADAMDARPDEGMEGGVFAPYGGKYEGSGRDRGLTPFPRTSEEQGSKIQKRGAESTDSLDVQNAFDVLGKAIGSKRGNEGSIELLKECSNIPPMSEALATSEKSEEGSPELPEKSGDEGQTA